MGSYRQGVVGAADPVSPVAVGGHRLELDEWPARDRGAPPLLLLHEGLGCLALWRDLPARLARATGSRVVAWSRYGYGSSDIARGPRSPSYLHEEALEALPRLREAVGAEDPVLIGHSDGASIALIHAGDGRWPVAGLVLLAPHVFVEERSLEGIRQAREAYRGGRLRDGLARYHRDPDATFWGWNDVWLSPGFREWNVEASLPGISCPVLVIQGTEDPYGTMAQAEAVKAGVSGPCRVLSLPGCGHAPHEERPRQVLAAVGEHISLVRAESGLRPDTGSG